MTGYFAAQPNRFLVGVGRRKSGSLVWVEQSGEAMTNPTVPEHIQSIWRPQALYYDFAWFGRTSPTQTIQTVDLSFDPAAFDQAGGPDVDEDRPQSPLVAIAEPLNRQSLAAIGQLVGRLYRFGLKSLVGLSLDQLDWSVGKLNGWPVAALRVLNAQVGDDDCLAAVRRLRPDIALDLPDQAGRRLAGWLLTQAAYQGQAWQTGDGRGF